MNDGLGWDWDIVNNDRWYVAAAAGAPGQWTFDAHNLEDGWYAIRILGSQNTNYSFNGVANNAHTDGTGWGYVRMVGNPPSGKLMAVQVVGSALTFTLDGPLGAEFYGFQLLPQYVEVTNCAAHDVAIRSINWTASASAATVTLPFGDKVSGATADGVFPVNYGFYVVAMSEEAYARQWGVNDNGTWGDAAGEDYPVFFVGDAGAAIDAGTATSGTPAILRDTNKNWAPGGLVGRTLRLTSGPAAGEARPINANSATQITVGGVFPVPPQPIRAGTGYEIIGDPVPDLLLIPLGPLDVTLRARQADGTTQVVDQATVATAPGDWAAYSSREKSGTPFSTSWVNYSDPPGQLEGSQNVSVSVTSDPPRSPGASIRSCLNKHYSPIWSGYPTLKTGSTLASSNQVYPIILNRPYPTTGWLGLVPTGNDPWRTIDPDPTPGTAPDDAEELLGTLLTHSTVGGVHSRFNINTAPVAVLKAVFDDGVAKNLVAEYSGKATGGAASTLEDSLKSWPTDRFNGCYVSISAGKGQGQSRRITDTSSNTLTVAEPWNTGQVPDDTSEYRISWQGWDVLLNDRFFTHAPDNAARDNRMGFYDDPASTNVANEDSGAGQIMDDFQDDTDEKEEWVRRYGNLFDHRTTAFRFVVAGIVYLDKDAAPTQDDVIADVRLEVDVDLGTDVDGDGKPDVQIVHMRYLSGQ